MSLANRKLDSIEAEYQALSPRASRFASELAKQLSQLVERCGVALAVPVQACVKSWDSLSLKLRRSPVPMETLRDTQDLVGLRLILLFRRDIEIVDTALEKSLRIIRVYDTDQLLRDDQFGYSSRHYVLGLPKEWASVPTFVGLEDLTAEIQVRTLAQHMWAEASHLLQYKREDSAPLSMRRALSRCSALLEMLDFEFDACFRSVTVIEKAWKWPAVACAWTSICSRRHWMNRCLKRTKALSHTANCSSSSNTSGLRRLISYGR